MNERNPSKILIKVTEDPNVRLNLFGFQLFSEENRKNGPTGFLRNRDFMSLKRSYTESLLLKTSKEDLRQQGKVIDLITRGTKDFVKLFNIGIYKQDNVLKTKKEVSVVNNQITQSNRKEQDEK